ncbi:glycosyltransferase family 61 protein [Flavobacterium cellulosilyticum]|uniref:Glycosyltransferase family 61 protein n=1 Tax=Flavobacterium cellulosilyticum TaxID=2541731 RepID=A0A4R5C523_9FLAO|nr:glycosyltransferase family 61 protein [Flavobacterium cellulosilyticum]TDD94738.1 glycosyltransferase family 61 protein [Flavobacterium cellulosilyticum]
MKITPIGYTKYLKRIHKSHMMLRQGKNLESLAVKSWEIEPGNITISPKAFFLDGQLDRITHTEFENPISIMLGGATKNEPTRAYMLKNTWMIDGSIYKDLHRFVFHHCSKLSTRKYFFPPIIIDTEIDNASIYNSYNGNYYFYSWLVDDCPLYQLAASVGDPVTTNIFAFSHTPEYENALEMNPIRTNAAFMKKAIFFDDNWCNNIGKHERFSANRNKLLSRFPGISHPGVFILRRDSGDIRIMINEMEIAEKLRDKYGFRIVDVTTQTATEIISACVGAKILIGIEGSQMAHGFVVLQPGASVIMLQPPYRFVGAMKVITDMEDINYGFIVGIPKEQGFYINFEEVERTMELFPSI